MSGFSGPCLRCGAEVSKRWRRGLCENCYSAEQRVGMLKHWEQPKPTTAVEQKFGVGMTRLLRLCAVVHKSQGTEPLTPAETAVLDLVAAIAEYGHTPLMRVQLVGNLDLARLPPEIPREDFEDEAIAAQHFAPELLKPSRC